MAKKTIQIDRDKCKGCGLCVPACPKKIVSLDQNRINARGYHPAQVVEKDKCTSCTLCAVMCPDMAIKIINDK